MKKLINSIRNVIVQIFAMIKKMIANMREFIENNSDEIITSLWIMYDIFIIVFCIRDIIKRHKEN